MFVYVYVCLIRCVSAPRAYLRNYTHPSNLHYFSACYQWPWTNGSVLLYSGAVMRYVLPVLWMTSCLQTTARSRRREMVYNDSAGGSTEPGAETDI